MSLISFLETTVLKISDNLRTELLSLGTVCMVFQMSPCGGAVTPTEAQEGPRKAARQNSLQQTKAERSERAVPLGRKGNGKGRETQTAG